MKRTFVSCIVVLLLNFPVFLRAFRSSIELSMYEKQILGLMNYSKVVIQNKKSERKKGNEHEHSRECVCV
jgi:hypothetical protein